ncbi:GDPD-domain-containing protein [Apiospora aurea]|uniref:GDPD-domain-containing protein n=1 Tax=Apiospora aurea TaxID=335848 RepID=A0ABR1QB62_9PEZI
MKFGCDFYTAQIPQWTNSYLDYGGLKQTLKQKDNDDQRYDLLDCSLREQTARLNLFIEKQSSLVSLWFQSIEARFSLHSATSAPPDWTAVALPELRDLEFNLLEALAFVEQLEVFSRVNRDAIAGILHKAEVTENWTLQGHGNGPFYLRALSAETTRMRALLQAVQRAIDLRPKDDNAASHSLILDTVDPAALGCSPDEVVNEIRTDNSSALMVVLASPVSYLENQAMLYSVTQVAIVHQSIDCIESLLDEITATLDGELCVHQDPLQQLITQFCRSGSPATNELSANTARHDLLGKVIRHLSPFQHQLLWVKDWRQRLPIHYAAHYGLVEVSSQMIKLMGPSAMLEADAFGDTPLGLAIISGHTDVVNVFVDLGTHRADGEVSVFTVEIVGSLMNIATRSASSDIVHKLIKLEKGINFQDRSGYTPLHHAARLGFVEIAKALLGSTVELDLSIADDSYSWTPLTVACVCGHVEVVRLLLLAGASPLHMDRRGWSALDHASYRGHMTIVAVLEDSLSTNTEDLVAPKTSEALPLSESVKPVSPRPTYVTPLSNDGSASSSVFVNLGSFDVAVTDSPVDLEGHVYKKMEALATPTHTYLEVSAIDHPDISHRVSIPFLGDKEDTTWQFLTEDADRMKLSFKLFEVDEESKGKHKLIASAVALLDCTKGWFRPERQSLRRDSAVALITPTGEFAGSVSFTFLVCKPYVPKEGASVNQPQKMRSLTPAQVIGHRGLGLNENELRRLQIGEHTLLSLESALDNGADFIEFDVQVTRDRVPVIYHDWAVSETGLDTPVHSMTYAQWMAISDSQTDPHHDAPRGRLPWDERSRPSLPPTRQSRSLCGRQNPVSNAMLQRMKHTVDYSIRNMKGNTRGDFIHDRFVTLRQLFEKFPEDVSFDIELKYPMLSEVADWSLEPYATEMNQYLDDVLDVVFELNGGKDRSIFFTCFNPEICILLSTKQKTYPVVFLNDSMVSGDAGDRRATSLQQAVRFARQWGLQGIVMAAEPLDLGLFCGSYGALNDIPELAKKQAAEGLDALVVNHVRLISNTLRGS